MNDSMVRPGIKNAKCTIMINVRLSSGFSLKDVIKLDIRTYILI